MPINKNSLQARINNLSLKTGVHQNILLKSFFFDAFLKRLEVSKYVDNFVFKGGFLLSTSLGINLRSTMDIDFLLRKIDFEKERILDILKEVSQIDISDNVSFQYEDVNAIRKDDKYGGYNITFLGKLENIKEKISIDIATGDPITPMAIDYKYRCLFENKVLSFKAYNFETILAEKLQTILVRDTINSRSKDYYDIYIIYKLRWNEINAVILKEAFKNTCKYRDTHFTKEDSKKIIERINDDSQLKARWNNYCLKNAYAQGIDFLDVVKTLLVIINNIF